MPLDPRKRIACAAFVVAAAIDAQAPADRSEPRFEVVSIRPVPANAPAMMREQTFTPVLPGGQYVDPRTSLTWMIAFAYDVVNPAIQLVGIPDWAKSQSYAVAAKAPRDSAVLPPLENQEQVRLMLRAMLADRFHLKLHTEMRQEAILSLEVAKGGFRLKPVGPPVPPEKEGLVNAAMGDSGGRIIGRKSTMAGMARMLVIFLKRPVID
ncbi:MAG TPA: TIGR03435 family protein, partial [Bryobacteraceae bacterium]